MMELAREAGWSGPDGPVSLCSGDHRAACALAADSRIDGVTLSGSLQAGYALQEICARRHIPFQGELGGNNGAIVWDDTDLAHAAREVAAGAFGFAGQRCTANRRVIVSDASFAPFMEQLRKATAALVWGDPFAETTVVGPLISRDKREQVAALLGRARTGGHEVIIPHEGQAVPEGAYHPPAIVVCDDANHEIVQEETFGPVLVVQRAMSFERALELLNGVRQGLIAALFSQSPARRQQFLAEARAGVIKFDRSTVDADATSPLGGWKASGVGPAEHGPSDREFFTRVQTVYNFGAH
jgi:acyl-CoA reductase-like NAD-dependent aldehyde dehydrogenase